MTSLERAIGPRLRTIAQAILPQARVADIGTDHAYLLAWLKAQHRIALGIGVDVKAGPLQQARRTLHTAKVDGIELRRGHGLQPLQPGEIDTVVLAGMGGTRMQQIIDERPSVVARLKRIVLQPNTDWVQIRRWIADHRWSLDDEQLVAERGRYYVVLAVSPQSGPAPRWDHDALCFGPQLSRIRSPIFVDWLRYELGRTERALTRASEGRKGSTPRMQALGSHRARLLRALGLED